MKEGKKYTASKKKPILLLHIYIASKKERKKERKKNKQTKWHVCPTKTKISKGIRPVRSEFSLSAWRKLGSLHTHWAHSRRLWSDWANAQGDLSLCWAQRSESWGGSYTLEVHQLSKGCLHKLGHWPTPESGKDGGCLHTVLSDVNLKSYVFLWNLSFSELRQYDL